MRAPRDLLRALLALVILLFASVALAQDGFRISYELDQSRPEKARVNGQVSNGRGQDVFDVSVTAEALNARGKVVARGISFVDARIGAGESRPFSVTVPTVPGVTGYRVVVSSYRAGFATQGP
jgi:hypothetical protein